MFVDKLNLGGLLKNAKKMQEMMEEAQAELAKIEVVGEAGAGAVKVTMNAKHVVSRIDIDDSIMQEDKQIVQDLIVAATNDATKKVEEITKSKLMDASALFGGEGNE